MLHSFFSRSTWFCCCVAALAQRPQPTGAIAGVASDALTGTPLRRAIITLSTVEPRPQDAVAWTDSSGRFAFSYLAPGRYQLRAQKDGYQTLAYGSKGVGSPPGTIQLAADEVRSNIVFRLQPTCSISGVVTGDDGEPVANTQVMAMTPGFERQKWKLLSGPGVMTDSDGRYRLTGLAPGKYAVAAANPRGVNPKLSSEVSAATAQSPLLYSFGAQYYAGAEHAEAATLIAVQAGREIAGIDFHLAARAAVMLQGKVIVPPGLKPADQVSVMIEEPGGRNRFGIGAAPPDFSFQLDRLIPGQYTVVAQATIEGKPYRGVQPIDLGPQGLRDLAIPLEPGIDLVGSVSVEGPDAAKHPAGFVTLNAGDGLQHNGPQPRATVNKDGSFKITGIVPGIWDIDAGPIPPGGYIKSMLLGDRDVLTQDMVIRSSTTGTLKIVLSTRAARLEGDVVQGDQPARAVVVLAPEAKLRHVASFYRVAAADEKGHFEIRNAVPGRYVLYAFESFDRRSLQDPNALKPFESSGVPVTLNEGPNESQKLSVLSGQDPSAPGERK